MAVLKANAYGLGVKPIAQVLEQAGAARIGVAELKEALKSDDKAQIEAKIQALSEVAQKMAEQAYAQNGGADAQGAAGSAESDAGSEKDENVVDADFEEVKDNKSK